MRAIWIVLTGIFIHGVSQANIKVKLQFSPIANLAYQLDCISGAIPHCSRNTYQDLWNKNFIKGADDQALIKKWGELMNRYHPALEFDESKNSDRFEGVKLSTKIRIASFQSMTMDEYFSRLDLVIFSKDREKFETVIRRFYPGFDKWWKATAFPKGKKFAKTTESLLVGRDMATKLQQFSHFYGAVLPDHYIVYFNLFYRPDFEESTSGQQIENYSVAEFLPNEKPVDRIDVIIHELCHFFFDSTADSNFASLKKEFDADGSLEARAAYNLLNETLASTLGNGLINKLTMKKERWEKYLAKQQSFYNNYHIDKAAKTILPWMEEWVNQGRTLKDSQFVSNYVSSLEKSFGAELKAPRLMLNELALIADNKYNGKFSDAVRKSIRASSMYNSEGEWSDDRLLRYYKENKNLSVLIVIHPSNLSQLKEKGILSGSDFDQFKSQYKKNEQVIYSFMRGPSVPGYIVVAADYDGALGLIEKIGSLKQGFDGAYQGP